MNSRKKILFVASSPRTHSHTEWEEEYMSIKTVLKNYELKKKYEIELICRATTDNISDHLPANCWLIHFSGHGKEGGKIFLEDEEKGVFIPRNRDLLEVLTSSNGVKCLLFNSCYSDKLAVLAKAYVDYAIGVVGTIPNSSAIDFVKCFYNSLARYETIPMAYKDAKRKFSLSQKEGVLDIVFECKNTFIMELVLQGRQEELQQLIERSDSSSQEINQIKVEVARLEEEQRGLLSGLLKNSPHPLGVAWFVDNYEQLASQVGNKILIESTEEERKDFSQEVSYLFGLLKACLVINDNLYSGSDITSLKSGNFPNSLFEQAFGEIPSLVPDTYIAGDFVPFLRDHIRHMISLL